MIAPDKVQTNTLREKMAFFYECISKNSGATSTISGPFVAICRSSCLAGSYLLSVIYNGGANEPWHVNLGPTSKSKVTSKHHHHGVFLWDPIAVMRMMP